MTFHILVVDDEAIYLETTALQLASGNYDVSTQCGGTAAIDYIRTNPQIDLILLDLMMPDIYGLEVLRILKEQPLTARIPIILQTGVADEEEIAQGMNMGANGYLRKPYNRQELLAVISGVLAH